MSVTVDLADLLSGLLVALNVATAVILIRFSLRAGASVERMERSVRDLEPEVARTLQAARRELDALQDVTAHVEGMAGDAERVVRSATESALPLLDDVDRLRRSARQMSALIHGLQVAVSTYKDLRH
ncbi:hypothetical protein KDK88_05040, partial [bacterium]|nr:hypothetical protein [bacterium]